MVTLKNLVNQLGDDVKEKDIIKMYIIENNLESEYISLITALSESIMKKNEKELGNIKSLMLFPNSNLYKEYKDNDVASRLDALTRCVMLGYNIKDNESLYNWCKENIPNIKMPKTGFYNKVILRLAELNIYFKDTNDDIIDRKFLETMYKE